MATAALFTFTSNVFILT